MQFSAGVIEKSTIRSVPLSRVPDEAPHFLGNSRYLRIFLLVGVAYIVRRRLHLQRERNDHYLLLAEEARAEYQALTRQMEGRYDTEKRLKNLVASRSTSSINSARPITNGKTPRHNRLPCFRSETNYRFLREQ